MGKLGCELREDVAADVGRRVVAGPSGGGGLSLKRAVGPPESSAVGDQGAGTVLFVLSTDDFARDHAAWGVRFVERPRSEPMASSPSSRTCTATDGT